ncbi:MAG TPA: YceI family protein [Verrucomicrobiae bacterium]|nr:YceI family protein [Verrucomicrobiae bacterium]
MMKTTLQLICLSVLAFTGFAAKAAETYNLDPAHSTVGFAVTHMVINTVHGKFNDFSGALTLDGGQVKEATGTIQTKSIDTGIERRDNHLRSPDFFDAAKFPTITFKSKRAEKQGSDMVLVGDFTMHGVTKELSLPVTVKGPIKDPWGNSRIGLQARAKLNRQDYGLKYNQALETGGLVVANEIELEINAEAVKAK